MVVAVYEVSGRQNHRVSQPSHLSLLVLISSGLLAMVFFSTHVYHLEAFWCLRALLLGISLARGLYFRLGANALHFDVLLTLIEFADGCESHFDASLSCSGAQPLRLSQWKGWELGLPPNTWLIVGMADLCSN